MNSPPGWTVLSLSVALRWNLTSMSKFPLCKGKNWAKLDTDTKIGTFCCRSLWAFLGPKKQPRCEFRDVDFQPSPDLPDISFAEIPATDWWSKSLPHLCFLIHSYMNTESKISEGFKVELSSSAAQPFLTPRLIAFRQENRSIKSNDPPYLFLCGNAYTFLTYSKDWTTSIISC